MNLSHADQMKMHQNSVAMTVALISWSMLFATMFLGYFLVRFNSPAWPPVEIEDLPQLWPFISTLVILLSSLTYWQFEKKALLHTRVAKGYWIATTLLGLGFLAIQWGLWAKLKTSGILVSNGMVPSMVYAFTWLHAAHIVLGICGLLWLGFYVIFRPSQLNVIKLINVGKFWHFLGVVWVLMYLMIFVL